MAMQLFTGWEYLLIDVANHYGYSEEYENDLDKLLFHERIQWTTDNLSRLEELIETSDTKTRPQYIKAVQALRKAQKGIPTGHLVGFDASCSGIQVMSALTGCETGAYNTGLVDPNLRADAYSTTTDLMNQILGGGLTVSRKDAKQALMTSYYGSKKTPKEIFGEDTPELAAFYQAAQQVAPGAWDLLHTLLDSWQPYALAHSWQLPDGFDALIKVFEKREARIEIDELDHATFTYVYYENQGTKSGLSNAANVVHSVDAYVLRCVHRRCNYDKAVAHKAMNLITQTLEARARYNQEQLAADPDDPLTYYLRLYHEHDIADVVILPYMHADNVACLETRHLEKLASILEQMLSYEPFEIVTIHDEFKCHPNNMNYLRQAYANTLADVADSFILSRILSQIHGQEGVYPKLTDDLGDKIRQSNYALC